MINYGLIKKIMEVTEEEKSILSGGELNRGLYMLDNYSIINSELLLEKGKLITLRPHTRFVEFPEHSHDYIELVYMCLGNTTHIINGKEVPLSEGELLFLSRNAKHSILPADKNDVAVNFIILPEFFNSSLSALGGENTPLKSFITKLLDHSGASDYLLFKVSQELPVQNLVENLIWNLMSDTKNKRTVNRITMELLFQHLLSCTDSIQHENKEDEIIIKLLKYIEDNFMDASLNEAAKMLYCDPSWLSREIKRKLGNNFTYLLQKKRLEQAVFYLKNTNMKITDISPAIGYDNISYFYRIFYETYKMTPKEFRACKSNKDNF